MKNLKINEKKLKEVLKKGIILTNVVFTLASVTACTKQEQGQIPEDWPSEFEYIYQHNNNFEDFTKTIIKNGEPTVVYNSQNIALAINKETYKVDEYLFYIGALSLAGKIFDIETGYLIADIDIFSNIFNTSSNKNDNIFLNNYDVIHFINISDYVEGETLKDYYSLEEIRNLEPAIVESVKKINEFNKKLVKK